VAPFSSKQKIFLYAKKQEKNWLARANQFLKYETCLKNN